MEYLFLCLDEKMDHSSSPKRRCSAASDVTGREPGSRMDRQIFIHNRWGCGSPHSPLLAADVMLLNGVSEEGTFGARYDPGVPGVHVEGRCEPCSQNREEWRHQQEFGVSV